MAKAQASQVSTPNWANRTIFEGDNLDILRGMNSASVDLVYLDPPFNSNRDYSAPIGSEAAGAAFKDAWTLSDVDEAWHGEIAERDERLYKVIEAAGLVHGKSMQSYLIFMTVRILELHRVLKPTGSIWLHCDPTASHYLKLVMDSILGKDNFRMRLFGSALRRGVQNGSCQGFMIFCCGMRKVRDISLTRSMVSMILSMFGSFIVMKMSMGGIGRVI